MSTLLIYTTGYLLCAGLSLFTKYKRPVMLMGSNTDIMQLSIAWPLVLPILIIAHMRKSK